MKNNIKISYILSFAKNTWFWLGIWVFYYLRFTNYAGIGIIETVLIVTTTLSEIPTGAVADLLGKRKTLIIAFFFEAVGSLLMTFAPNFNTILFAVFIMCVGGAFYSGTLDALIYDSLKQESDLDRFDKVISNINSIALLAPAICSIIGGYAYAVDPRYPFLLNSMGYILGLAGSYFLVEPLIDSEKFSFKNYLSQTKQGFLQLFKNKKVIFITMTLLLVGFVTEISLEMTDSFVSFEFGFTDKQMGILWSVIFIVSALASQLTKQIKDKFGSLYSIYIVSLIMILSYFVSPFVGMVVGGISLILRSSAQSIFGNLVSIEVNKNTDSKYRATTLSSFNMIKNVPYVLTAYFIGGLADKISAKVISFYFGVFLFLGMVASYTYSKINGVSRDD